jgi:phage terminase large subunit-like protein
MKRFRGSLTSVKMSSLGASKVDDYVILATSSEGTSRNGVGDTIKLELQDILRGIYFDPHTSIWHYKLDDISEIGYPEMWLKANPNLGATVSYDTYQKDVNLMESVPSKRNDILAKRFGILLREPLISSLMKIRLLTTDKPLIV